MASHAEDRLYATSPKRMRFSCDDEPSGPVEPVTGPRCQGAAQDRGGQPRTSQPGSGPPFWMDSNFHIGQFRDNNQEKTDDLSDTCRGKETPPPPPDLDPACDTTEDASEDGGADDTVDEDDSSSTLSSVSDLSGLSDISGREWKPIASMRCTVEKLMMRGISPRAFYSQLTGDNTPVPESISDIMLWKLIAEHFAEIPNRHRLPNISTLDDVVCLLKNCSKIIVLTGAGVSVSCGIPDFRSKDGVYARLAVDFPDLPDPHSMFDIGYFRRDPRPFFKFACEIYPGQFKPSPCHRFIKMLEKQNKLLRNYTQNIDTLEKVAGIENVVECHGSFATATCTRCGHSVSSEAIRETVFRQEIPFCPKCSETGSSDDDKGVMKPDIVFFGEGLPESFHCAMSRDKDECDLLIVIGSSLKVRPVSLIPSSLPGHVPQVLINRERLPHLKFDVELLGDSDIVIDHLCHLLGDSWKEEICWREGPCEDCSGLFPDCSSDIPRPESTYSSSDEWSDVESLEGATAVSSRPHQRVNRPSASYTNTTATEVASSGSDSVSTTAVAKSGDDSVSSGGTTDVEEAGATAAATTTATTTTTTTTTTTATTTTAASSTAGGRHMSLDSSRDSGIGESSNSSNERSPSPALPQPVLVPESSYFRLKERRYVFPGAEVFTRHRIKVDKPEPANQ